MAKFHINLETGEANKCSAVKGKCPFGGDDKHFTSETAAREAIETRFDEFYTHSGFSKKDIKDVKTGSNFTEEERRDLIKEADSIENEARNQETDRYEKDRLYDKASAIWQKIADDDLNRIETTHSSSFDTNIKNAIKDGVFKEISGSIVGKKAYTTDFLSLGKNSIGRRIFVKTVFQINKDDSLTPQIVVAEKYPRERTLRSAMVYALDGSWAKFDKSGISEEELSHLYVWTKAYSVEAMDKKTLGKKSVGMFNLLKKLKNNENNHVS